MSARNDLRRQIVDELDVVLAAPVGSLLGTDLADAIRARIGKRAGLIAAQLAEADAGAAQVAIDLANVLWGNGNPPATWWRTPLGRACARSLATDDSEALTFSVAGAMLGVTRGRAHQLAVAGKLKRHPDGGVTRASVLVRMLATDGQ